MSSALRRDQALSIDEFLMFADARSDERWELVRGAPRAMVGSTLAHASIAANIVRALGPQAHARGCRALNGFLVQATDASAFEPDALVLCGPFDNRSRVTTNPSVVFEVLSPSTMDFDRSTKVPLYRRIDGLQQLVLVYQDSVRVESWLRREDGWTAEPDILLERTRSLALPSIAGSLALSTIYEGVVPTPLGN